MKKEPEGGGVFAAQMRSYTGFLTVAAGLGLIWFAQKDLGTDGARILPTALGTESKTWTYVALVVGLIMASWPVGAVAALYHRYTGNTYMEDRIGFAKSGGRDIGFWSGFLTFVGLLYVFGHFVPAGALGFLRPFAVLLGTLLVGTIVARTIARVAFNAQFGPPR